MAWLVAINVPTDILAATESVSNIWQKLKLIKERKKIAIKEAAGKWLVITLIETSEQPVTKGKLYE